MILKDTLRMIVKEQKKQILAAENTIIREALNQIPINLPYAIIISGIRRAGKSTLLQQLFQKFPDFYYFNFEDTRLIDFDASDFEKLDQILLEEYGPSKFYIFDEIQNIKSWEIFVRSRLDNGKQFFITGSNASLLSRELGTRLTGRHINVELFPFSYNEELQFYNKGSSIDAFDEYFRDGGFPEYLKYKQSAILQELLMDIIYRGIVIRHSIRDAKSLHELAIYLLANTGKEFSYNSMKKTFNFGSVNTAISYISYMEDSYLLFTIQKFDYSLKKQAVNEKKVYAIDNGIILSNSTSLSSDRGRLLENIVFIALRKKYRDIYYFRENGECDFVVRVGKQIIMAIQVCYEITSENKDRELNGLMEALNTLKLNEGLILTYKQEDKIIIHQKTINIIPVWKWL